jgi:hypothetical protein
MYMVVGLTKDVPEKAKMEYTMIGIYIPDIPMIELNISTDIRQPPRVSYTV